MPTNTERIIALETWMKAHKAEHASSPLHDHDELPTALVWGLIPQPAVDPSKFAVERQAGINTRLFELSWSSYESAGDGIWNGNYITNKKAELAAIRSAGFKVILSMGVQTAPSYIFNLPNALYVDQYGLTYTDASHGHGRANAVWNPSIRSKMSRYIARVLADFGTDFYAIRVGGSRYGELGYPVNTWNGRLNTYWAYDANAQASCPVPGWKPGQASPNGEARKFADWYMNKLTEFQNWQVAQVRTGYPGRIMVLYPSWGIRPGQLDAAIAVNLNGSTSAESNGEVPRGFDWARNVPAITDPNVVITSTWLDPSPDFTDDASTDPRRWSPMKYLASFADPKGLEKFGENTGQGTRAEMDQCVARVEALGMLGMLWYREDELLSGQYATLADYAAVIEENDGG